MHTGELIALAFGRTSHGKYHCVYCGAPACTPHTISDSFTAHATLMFPASKHACEGCLLSMAESGTAHYYDGTTREWPRSFMRGHSWLLTESESVPIRYQDKAYLLDRLLQPPRSNWLACITTGGQRHFLYQAVVNTVSLDGEPIYYTPAALRFRLDTTLFLSACVGAVNLDQEPGPSLWGPAFELFGERAEKILIHWAKVWAQPLSRLAIYFTPKKEDALRELDARTASVA